MTFKLMVNSKPGDTGGSKEKIRVKAVRLVLWELGFLIPSHLCHCLDSFSQNNNYAPKAKNQSDPIRNPIRSGVRSDPEYNPIRVLLTADLLWSQEKIKTTLLQNFGRQTKSIIVFLKVAYWRSEYLKKQLIFALFWNEIKQSFL